jgi:hypothetical protein
VRACGREPPQSDPARTDGAATGLAVSQLTSVDVGSKRNGFEFRKLFIEEKRKDFAYLRIEERRRRQALMVCRLI